MNLEMQLTIILVKILKLCILCTFIKSIYCMIHVVYFLGTLLYPYATYTNIYIMVSMIYIVYQLAYHHTF